MNLHIPQKYISNYFNKILLRYFLKISNILSKYTKLFNSNGQLPQINPKSLNFNKIYSQNHQPFMSVNEASLSTLILCLMITLVKEEDEKECKFFVKHTKFKFYLLQLPHL